MRILFTTSDSPLSRLIRKVTSEPVSHCAFEVGGWIIHSNLKGVHVETPQTFTQKSRIIYSIDIPFDLEKLIHTFGRTMNREYDFGALLYLGARAICPWLPKKNLWQCTGMYLCTELITQYLGSSENSMITPYQLYKELTDGTGLLPA